MISTNASAILFDDFALLTQQLGRQRLVATSVNTNCDCAGSPSLNADCDCAGSPLTSRYDDRHTNQIAQPVA
ncbi:hypothetical protein [uncultured Fibrella sp.]|uniref:hypothetical protein n=1 Tax=uncultured Fibrella sp. TaxID=1284596 RepID=UPI0035CA9934